MAIRRTEEMARKIWQTTQKEHEKLVNPVTTDNPDFDKAWNEDRLLQRLDDSESKMSIGEYAKYWFQKGQEYAQPKWTLCRDRLPKEKDGKVITTHETDASFYSHEIKVIRVYVKLETQNPFNETRIDNFCLSTNKFEKYEDLVIAWMPLPDAHNLNKNNKERTK